MTNGSGILLYQTCRVKKSVGDGKQEYEEGKMKNMRVKRKHNKRNKK